MKQNIIQKKERKTTLGRGGNMEIKVAVMKPSIVYDVLNSRC